MICSHIRLSFPWKMLGGGGGVAEASLEDPKIRASKPPGAWSGKQGALLCDSLRSKLCHCAEPKPTRSFMVVNGLPGIFSYTFSFEQFLKIVVSKLNLKQTECCFQLTTKPTGIVPKGLFSSDPCQSPESRSYKSF